MKLSGHTITEQGQRLGDFRKRLDDLCIEFHVELYTESGDAICLKDIKETPNKNGVCDACVKWD